MDNKPVRTNNGPLARLVDEIGRAATSGWAQTARLALLLIIGAVAMALILAVYR